MKPLLAGILAATSLVIAAPAQAAPQTFFFQCAAAAPLGSVSNLNDASTWSPTAPTTAFPAGGCVSADTWQQGAEPGNTAYDTVFGGDYAGEVKQFDLTLYSAASDPAYRQIALPPSIDVTLQVDGETVFAAADLQSFAEPATLQNSYKSTWTISELDIPKTDKAKSFVLTVNTHFTDDPTVWGSGASDLPSGITFYAQEDLPPVEEEEGL